MSLITWECLRCVQELTTISGPQNRIQGSCEPLLSEPQLWQHYDLLIALTRIQPAIITPDSSRDNRDGHRE